MMKGQKKRSLFVRGGWQMALCAVLVLALVGINCLFGALGSGTRLDMTANGVYTLSETTRALLNGLEQEVEVLCVAQDGSADTRLDEILTRYDSASENVHVRTITAAESLYYSSAELSAGSIVVTNGEYDAILDYSSLYLAEYEQTGYYQTLVAYDIDAENQINAAIAGITADLPIAYMLAGQAETALDNGMASLLSAEGYHVKNLYLSELSAIPEDCGMILINVPQEDISRKEADLLIEWLQSGGSIFLVTDFAYGEMAELSRVTQHVGMSMSNGVIMEGDLEYMYGADYPYYLLPETVSGNGITQDDANSPLMALAHGITFASESDYTHISLLSTSDSAYLKPNAYSDGIISYADGDVLGPFTVAAVAEKQGEGKLFWLGSSQCLNDNIDTMASGANYTLVQGVLRRLHGQEPAQMVEQVASRSVLTPGVNMTQDQFTVFVGVCLLIPVAIFIIGTIMSIKRHRNSVSQKAE